MGKKGDAVMEYDDVEIQEIKFNELVEANYLPIALKQLGKDLEKNTLMKAFDPDVDEVLFMPRVVGG